MTRERVAELERSDRLEEAAALAEAEGDPATAARLWERACVFDRAARAALTAGDPARAVELAARAGAADVEADAIGALAKTAGPAALVAARLSDQGRHGTAARLWLALGDASAAAQGFERAGAWLDAARAHAAASNPRHAARCLERAIEAGSDGFEAHVLLGELYLAHARHDAAVRVLQRVPPSAPERGRAVVALARALEALGLDAARAELEPEFAAPGPHLARGPAAGSARARDDAPVLFGRYRVLAEVARTPTARVLRAHDQVSGDEVAVKLFSATALRDAGRDALVRFEREAVALGKLRHPAIVPLRGFYPEGPAVVLEWMPGGSLADALEQDTVAPARAAEVAIAVLGALAEAHRRGILHRDIKPANVLFDAAGAPRLADFGAAHVADAAATVTSGVIGTLAYMAPEQRAGAPASVKSDIYGVGALFWHALTDAPPAEARPFLSEDLGPAERALAARLVGPEAGRPASALEARDRIAALDWPRARPARRAPTTPPSLRGSAAAGRLRPVDGARHLDTWLGREVLVLPLGGPDAERARAFARAAHPALASVLAVRAAEDAIWVEAPRGETPTRLSAAELRVLEDALVALHRAGAVHGCVDAAHVVRRGGETLLAFPLGAPAGSPEDDLARLRALG